MEQFSWQMKALPAPACWAALAWWESRQQQCHMVLMIARSLPAAGELPRPTEPEACTAIGVIS